MVSSPPTSVGHLYFRIARSHVLSDKDNLPVILIAEREHTKMPSMILEGINYKHPVCLTLVRSMPRDPVPTHNAISPNQYHPASLLAYADTLQSQ